ncbi:MAG: AbrB/MazE/SpoVT family DNA-binding domain-containing protein [Anaerolineae bacterium]
METRVQRWGNSLALRIPRPLANEVGLKDNSSVQLSLHDGQLVIVPLLQPTLSLEALLAQVNEDNRHGEVLSGSAMGGEAW